MDKDKLLNILENFSNLEKRLNSLTSDNFKDFAHLSKEYSDLKPLVKNVNEKSIDVYVLDIGEIEIKWEGLKWARKYISENRRT